MKTILVVDDNEDNLDVISRMLEFDGYTVRGATNGQTALDRLNEDRPDLILMDLAMPEMDGWTAAAKLKSDPQLRHIPVIVVTGHLTSDDINRALEAGCEDVVSKPIDFYILSAKVRRHLGRPSPMYG